MLKVSQDSGGDDHWLKVPEFILSADTTYNLAVSIGKDGLMIWLDGVLVAAEPHIAQGLGANDYDLLLGASRAWRSSQTDAPHSLMHGTISDFAVFDKQMSQEEVIAIAGIADPMVEMHADMHLAMADLTPALQQLHHGSDTLREIAADYGVSDHGHLPSGLNLKSGGAGANTMNGTAGADGLNGKLGDDKIDGKGGNDFLQGGYGNDKLIGGAGNDVLDGGHGEDRLYGGGGDDLLISQADGREGAVYFDPNRDEGDPLNELTNGKLYADQPLPANDLLMGGAGADVFYFQTLINAKQRYIEKHTNSDGTINWHGVAGENDKIHDHWVDVIGYDTVMDFDKSEGDRIVIEGHTTEILKINYGDANNDGVLDHSIIWLYSEQGNNGGAHNDDRLGKIKVFGDLLQESDIEHSAAPAYGIVKTIDDLEEAVKPVRKGEDGAKIGTPKDLNEGSDFDLSGDRTPVLQIAGDHVLDGESGSYLDAGHQAAMESVNLTVSLTFSASQIFGTTAIISKDGSGHGDGGGFNVWIMDGKLVVTQDEKGDAAWLKVPEFILAADTEYHLAVSFGKDGIMIWVDGELMAAEPEFKQGLMPNDYSLVIGGSRAWRDSQTDNAHSLFEGTISDVAIFDTQLATSDVVRLTGMADPQQGMSAAMHDELAALTPALQQLHHGSDTLKMIAADYGLSEHGHMPMGLNLKTAGNGNNTVAGTSKADGLNGNLGDDVLKGKDGKDFLQGGYGNDKLIGGGGHDVLDGGHGEDRLFGGGGNDLLISQADGREGAVYFDPNRDEGDPLNELTNGKLYPDQLVHADDMLTGGKGADIFYFQSLINAKERYIGKHTKSDGTINWHGVAGENDKIHDHWVDVMGYDVVMDYSRAQGDRIVIEGHTTEILKITYGDADGDGAMDHSVIWLYSDQGNNGGAHNDDRLGKIKVFGDLLAENDIEHSAAPAYGIVKTIEDLDEALSPLRDSVDGGNIGKPNKLNSGADLTLDSGATPTFTVPGSFTFEHDEKSHLAFLKEPDLRMDAVTVMFSFRLDELGGYKFLFSKDASDFGDGGHTSAWVNEDGDLVVRIQSKDANEYLVVDQGVVTGQMHDFALAMGAKGAELYLDGVKMSYDRDVKDTWSKNAEALVIGGNNWSSDAGTTNMVNSRFDGVIKNFAIYDEQVSAADIDGGKTRDGFAELDAKVEKVIFSTVNGDLTAKAGGDTVALTDDIRFLELRDATLSTDNLRFGSGAADEIDGNEAADLMLGKGGDDRLWGKDHDDFLFGGAGDDDLYGGRGSDTAWGEDGEDYLDGGEGADVLYGGAGNDELKGSDGNDIMYGGWGDDYIYGQSWGEAGSANNDRVVYDGEFDDYSFKTETYYHSGRKAEVDRLVVTDHAGGGSDGFYEGQDRLLDIDVLIFADRTVEVADLI